MWVHHCPLPALDALSRCCLIWGVSWYVNDYHLLQDVKPTRKYSPVKVNHLHLNIEILHNSLLRDCNKNLNNSFQNALVYYHHHHKLLGFAMRASFKVNNKFQWQHLPKKHTAQINPWSWWEWGVSPRLWSYLTSLTNFTKTKQQQLG